MRPLIMALLAIVITTSACRKERANVDTRMPPKQVRLSKIVWDNRYYTWEYSYVYDNAGYLREIITTRQHNNDHGNEYETITRIAYERDAANYITKETQYDGENTITGTYVYSNNPGLPERIDYKANGQPYYTQKFTWDRNNLIVRESISIDGETISRDEMLYDDNGNIQELVYQPYNNFPAPFFRYHNIRHDNKPNYTHTIKGAILANLPGIPDIQGLSANNVTVAEEMQPDINYPGNNIPDWNLNYNYVGTSTYNLTYNGYNYVSKAVKNNGQQTTEYFYEEVN